MEYFKKFFIVTLFILFFLNKADAADRLNIDYTFIKTKKMRKYIMDLAVTEKYVFVLCMYYKNKTDAIVKLNRKTGKRINVFFIGKYRATAIENSNNALWVLSRRRKAFIRKISYTGKILLKISRPRKKIGSIYGCAINGNKIYFSATKNNTSTVYIYNINNKSFSKLYSLRKKIYSLTYLNGKLYAYQKRKSLYSHHWLIITDIKTGKSKKMHFLHRFAWGLANDKKNLYLLYRKRGKAVIHSFYVIEKKQIILGRFVKKNVTAVYKIRNKNRNPYKIKLWLPKPIEEKYNKIKNLRVYPAPLKTVLDAFGNKWFYFNFSKLRGNKYITFKFTYIYSTHSSTLNKNYILKQSHIPNNIKEKYLKPTRCFNYNNTIVRKAFLRIKNKIKNYTLIKKILAIHNLTNDIIIKDRASGKLTRASDIIKFRHGRCYYHTVLFAAFLRLAGIPARAIGGQRITGYSPHSWNQVYFPGSGWIDVDTTRNDNEKNGKHYLGNIGNRRGNADYMITFRGNYDKRNFKNVFTCRGWRMTYRWSSLNRRARAQVKVKLNVKSR